MTRTWRSAVFLGAIVASLLVASLALGGCGKTEPVLEVVTTERGHQEVALLDDGSLEAVFLGNGGTAGLCAEVPVITDTSRWEVELTFSGRPSPDGFVPAAHRMGSTVCFDGRWPTQGVPDDGDVELCADGIDRFDGSRFRLPCRRVRRHLDDTLRRDLEARLDALFAASGVGDLDAWLPRLDALAAEADTARFPLLRVRLELIAVHFLTLEGSASHLAQARRRLAALPPWLDRPEASARGAQAAYQRGLFALDAEGRLDDAWGHLAAADRRYHRIADPNRFLVTVQQAAILAQLGVSDEAVDRLTNAIEDCAVASCDPELLAHAQGELAWLILLDPYARRDALERAERYLADGLATLDSEHYPLEVANQLINLAYLRTRQERSPAKTLDRAEALLATAGLTSEGAERLRDWATLVRGLAALRAGQASHAAALCSTLGEREDPQLSAWAWSCLGRAQRHLGATRAAARSFEQALLRHEHGRSDDIGQRLPLGPGQRGDDFAQAARLALEMGSPAEAWELLARLDRVASGEGERRRCREQAGDETTRRQWQALDEESKGLLRQLASLDDPAGGRRAQEIESVRRELKERLRQLWRHWPGCASAPSGNDAGLRFRAVALEDEVLLLQRSDDGEVRLEKRTPLALGDLVELTREISRALDERRLDDRAWRRLVAPLAEALLPTDLEALPEVSTFALQGLLQEAPMAALPLPADAGAGWLGEITAVALHGAGSGVAARHAGSRGEPLFVVDPRGDLPGASRLVETYRELFPDAHFLRGPDATRDALRRELPAAGWLHVDAHGLYETAFPELSAIQLADRPLGMVELAELPMGIRFANLSGCQTGRWPTTADSGRYGIGGLLSRLGVEWVIGSRYDLEDTVAGNFNRAFYESLRRGDDVPGAYREALSEIRRLHPASSWAGIVLLGSGPPPVRGQEHPRGDS